MRSLLLLLPLLTCHMLFAQGVGINNPAPDPSALLDLTSTDRGLLVPRLTTVQRDDIPVPALSLLIYNTSNTRFEYYNGSAWVPLVVSGGTLDAAYDFGGPGMGRTIIADAGAVRVEGTDGLQVTGTFNSGATLDLAGPGSRMFFNPRKAAFRAGMVQADQWDDANVGLLSAAWGLNTIASGANSMAWGFLNTASGDAATVWGSGNEASGSRSTVWGSTNLASNTYSSAWGFNNQATGLRSTAWGRNTQANGENSTAWGENTTASLRNSTAFGENTTASASNSTAFGVQTTASGIGGSMSIGSNTTASGFSSLAGGSGSVASGQHSFSFGGSCEASGLRSVALGYATLASDNAAFAMGYETVASNFASVAMGSSSQSLGTASFSMGVLTVAQGSRSFAMGTSNLTQGISSVAMGHYNNAYTMGETVIGIGATLYTPSANGNAQFGAAQGTDRIFAIGNAVDLNGDQGVQDSERRNAMVVLKNGNSTIGNADPNTRLDVVAGTTGTITRVMTVRSAFNANNTGTGIALINSTANASNVGSEIISVTTNATTGLSDLRFHVHGGGGANGALNERMRILGNGNVGIGVIAPTQSLHVAGNIRMVDGNQAAGRVLVSAADGTASWQALTPAQTSAWSLDGNAITAAHVLGSTNNISLKFMVNSQTAGEVSNGGLRTFLGYRAGENNTGASNTFIGYFSGLANTTGANNTFIGVGTGENNVGAGDGTFVGRSAGIANTTGVRNTYIGRLAGSTNLAGLHNAVLGYGAGNAANGFVACTFLGYDADGNNTTSLSNSVAVGNLSRITADNQVRIGNAAMTSIGGFAGWTNLSDGTFKTQVQENVPGLALIMSLRPVTYRLDRDQINEVLNVPYERPIGLSDVQTGFIAQEVESVARSLGYEFSGVDAPKNSDDHYGLRYATFTVPLVKAVQEQQEQIEAQRRQLDEQSDTIARLMVEMEAMRATIGMNTPAR